jgi:hypothetical protein
MDSLICAGRVASGIFISAPPGAETYSLNRRRSVMGLLEDAEKIAGAVIAVEGVKKVDPNASILTEGAAAIAGFEGAGALAEHFEKKEDEPQQG